jgi:hypothetical protein
MKVFKTTVSFDVYLAAEDEDDATKQLQDYSLNELINETEDGEFIGSPPHKTPPVEVPAENLQRELQAIGNDGTFFEDFGITAEPADPPQS